MTKAFMIFAYLLNGEVLYDHRGFESNSNLISAEILCVKEGERLLSSGEILDYQCRNIIKRRSM